MNSYFITATGTDIGKTFVTCALAYATGRPAYKPLISGFEGTDTDTHRLIEAMGGVSSPDDVSPWRYRAPLSPDMAAMAEGQAVPYDALVAWSRTRAAAQPCFIEGVGGAMVPLTAEHTTRDWMRALNLPLILVAGSYLGSISHTLTALEALDGMAVQAIILSESAQSTVSLEATRDSLARHTETLLVLQPRVSSYREASAIHALARELP